MSFEEWQATVPECIKRDKLWEFVAYQKALWLYDLAWDDCDELMKDIRGRGNADQLNRSAGSICANIEEGYGRGFGKEYDYFTRVALGSARECRGWYLRSRRLLSPEVIKHRMGLCSEIIASLVNRLQESRKGANGRGLKAKAEG